MVADAIPDAIPDAICLFCNINDKTINLPYYIQPK